MNRPGLMIAIMPHAGEPDEDHLERESGERGGEEGFGRTSAHDRIANLVAALTREGPSAARKIKLYSTSLMNLVDAFLDRDRHGLEQAAEEAVDHLHELIVMTRNDKGGQQR